MSPVRDSAHLTISMRQMRMSGRWAGDVTMLPREATPPTQRRRSSARPGRVFLTALAVTAFAAGLAVGMLAV